MKTTLFITGLLILAGCSATPYLDAEYGAAYRAVQDQQVAFPEAPYAQQTPEGLEGITAEEVMDRHNQSYAKQDEGENRITFDLGGSSSGSK